MPNRARPAALASALIAAVALTSVLTGCSGGRSPSSDSAAGSSDGMAALTGVSQGSFEDALAAHGWKLAYRKVDTGHETRRDLRIGRAQTGKLITEAVEAGDLPSAPAELTCQAVGADTAAAEDFLKACAAAAPGGAGTEVDGWLTAEFGRASSGTGHELRQGGVRYHLAVAPRRGLHVLDMSVAGDAPASAASAPAGSSGGK
ncbi:hypothetical protein [Phaeacidiphilus oryzae]|uniref:hypothetical protein n=1 Tax=Phaeacidiphilus oryzae TaxID=348818 RepID=UPI00056569E1|nr:hypothetical protein [Phaeacidiphilus oryzae]